VRNRTAMVLSLALFGFSPLAHAEPRLTIPRAIGHDTWITNADSPPEGTYGVVSFKLLIGTDGMPTSCEITKSSGYESLDNLTCHLVQRRARFTPATLDGKPSESSYFDTVHWLNRSSGGVPFTVSARNVVTQFDIDANGKITNCSVDGAKTTEENSFCRFHDRIAVPVGEPQIRNAHVTQTTRVEITPH